MKENKEEFDMLIEIYVNKSMIFVSAVKVDACSMYNLKTIILYNYVKNY